VTRLTSPDAHALAKPVAGSRGSLTSPAADLPDSELFGDELKGTAVAIVKAETQRLRRTARSSALRQDYTPKQHTVHQDKH
jgi:hypothetical protein